MTVDKHTESNILAEGPEWVAKGLLDLKEHELFSRDEPIFLGLQLALGTPRFDQTLASEVRLMKIVETVDKD